MTSVPRHLQVHVDSGLLLRSQAAAINAFVGDLATVAQADLHKGRVRKDSDAASRWATGSGPARRRVEAALAVIGGRGRDVLHMIGGRDLSLAQAAEELGWRPDEVRVILTLSARDLLKVYGEFVEAGPRAA